MLIAFTESVILFVRAILGVKVRNVPILASYGRTLIVAMDVFARNIWQSGDTRGMIRDGRPFDEALAESDLA